VAGKGICGLRAGYENRRQRLLTSYDILGKVVRSMKSLKSVNISLSISPVTRWIITIVVLVAVLAVVTVLYVQQQTRNNELKDDLSKAQTSLVNNGAQKDVLSVRLVTANLALSQLQAEFVSPTESISLEEAVYKAAAVVGVEVSNIGCTAPASETVGNRTYQVYTVTLDALGEVEPLLRFINVLGDLLPSAGMGDSVSMGTDESGQSSLTLRLAVYALGS
jgi:hypothetical protein